MTTSTAEISITPDQRAQFARDGYFITDVVFDEPTLQIVRDDFNRMWNEDIESAKKSSDDANKERTQSRSFMSQLDRRSKICDDFCRNEFFHSLSRQLLGPDVDLSWNQAIIKAPMPADAQKNPRAFDNHFAWHQDLWYGMNSPEFRKTIYEDVYTNPDNALTCWCAISRTIVDNGTLWVLPGRHKEGLFPHKWHDTRMEWQAQIDTSYKIPVVLRAGQVLVFKKHLPHSSGTNIWNEPRMAYQIGYSKPGQYRTPSPNDSPLLRNNEPV